MNEVEQLIRCPSISTRLQVAAGLSLRLPVVTAVCISVAKVQSSRLYPEDSRIQVQCTRYKTVYWMLRDWWSSTWHADNNPWRLFFFVGIATSAGDSISVAGTIYPTIASSNAACCRSTNADEALVYSTCTDNRYQHCRRLHLRGWVTSLADHCVRF
jgi:hypothetical protein